MEPRGCERHRWANREVEMGGSTWSQCAATNEFQTKEVTVASAFSEK